VRHAVPQNFRKYVRDATIESSPATSFDDSYLDQFRSTVIRPFITNRTEGAGVRSKFDLSGKPDLQKLAFDVIIAFK